MSILNGSDLKSLVNLTGEQVCAHLAGDFLYYAGTHFHLCVHIKSSMCNRGFEDEGIYSMERNSVPGSEV